MRLYLLGLYLLCLAGSVFSKNEKLLEAQFLNVPEDLNGDSVSWILDENAHWYNISVDTDEERVKRNRKDLNMGTEPKQTPYEYSYETVQLSFTFPFFGRTVSSVIVTSAGAILMGDPDDPNPLPSHIAPLLSSLPQGDDQLVYFDSGTAFTVQWTKHYLHDDRYKQEVHLTIYQDGSMTFLYHNLIGPLLELAKNQGYPIVIGLQDGFALPGESGVQGKVDYLYPSVHVDASNMVSNYSMINITPCSISSSCGVLDEEKCAKDDRCGWCDVRKECVYMEEKLRPSNKCTEKKAPCNNDCSTERDQVCGSDGISYDNECSLLAFSCNSRHNITLVSKGSCPPNILTNVGNNCTNVCPLIHKPVCGSDGITYVNLCSLEAASCSSVTNNVTKASDGRCDGKDYDYDHLESDGDNKEDDGNAVKNCNKNCNKNLEPVCLNGEKLFSNKCMMEQAICEQDLIKMDVKEGTCESKNSAKGLPCPTSCPIERNPVCGSNSVTYANECVLRQIVCTYGLDISKASDGFCNGPKECPPGTCTLELNPVCGSDGKTYNNKCLLEAAAACVNKGLVMVESGPCDNREVLHNDDGYKFVDLSDAAAGRHEDSNSLGRALKGAAFIAVCLGIALLAFAVVKLYRRPQNLAPRDHQHSGASSVASPAGTGIAPNNPTTTAGAINAVVELGIIRGNRSTAKYDKLPLVPHMEDEGHFSV